MSFYLNVNGIAISEDKYVIEGIVKKSPAANNILWKAVIGSGLHKVKNASDGYYYILMPDTISALFLPGTYYLDIKLTEKVGTGDDVADITFVGLSTTFTINLSASSPNPDLRPTKVEESSYDPETGITTVTVKGVEPTLPLPINVI